MSRGYKPEQIISMLRETEVGLAQGQTVGQACRSLGVSEQSSGTNSELRNLLHTQGGTSADREVAPTLQHDPAT